MYPYKTKTVAATFFYGVCLLLHCPAVNAQTTATEKSTDVVARKVVQLINNKQADSVYLFAGEQFRKALDAPTFRNILETKIFMLTPLAAPAFKGSKNGISRYKMDALQLLIGLDSAGKYNTLLIQPYQEWEQKTGKILSDNPLKTSQDSIAEKVLSAYIKTKGNVGVSAAIWADGKASFYNYGETITGNNTLPTQHSLYDIGSITKTFTTTLLAIAVEQGKVKLNTPIKGLLPDSVAANTLYAEITLEQLANHTSGLPRLPDNLEQGDANPNQPYAHYGNRQLFSFLKNYKPVRKPGVTYEYSNFGMGVLGVLLERIYHKPYQELVKQYILQPAKLSETYFTINTQLMSRLARGYNEEGKQTAPWNFLAMQSAGALKSSAADLLQYGRLQLGTTDATLAKALQLAHLVTYSKGTDIIALGWHILPDNPDVIWHSGGTGGYRTALCIDLKKKIVVAVLTNNASTGDAIGRMLMNAIQKEH